MKDLIIVGAGPAGVTAAIYAKRSGINFEIYEKAMVGGNVVNAFEIENYPGVGKIMGADLALKYMDDLAALKIDVNYDEVVSISQDDDHFDVKFLSGKEESYKKVLLALGTKPKKLGISKEEEFLGRGVSFCATCDGSFYVNKEVLVVGGGNSALTEALYLANIVKKVYLITRHELKGDKKEIEKIRSKNNIEVMEFKSVKEILGEKKVEGVTLIDTNDSSLSNLTVDGMFEYIGQLPPTSFVANLGILNERGFIVTDAHFETKCPGVFAIGDCISKEVRQIVTAAGDAAVAIHYINE